MFIYIYIYIYIGKFNQVYQNYITRSNAIKMQYPKGIFKNELIHVRCSFQRKRIRRQHDNNFTWSDRWSTILIAQMCLSRGWKVRFSHILFGLCYHVFCLIEHSFSFVNTVWRNVGVNECTNGFQLVYL